MDRQVPKQLGTLISIPPWEGPSWFRPTPLRDKGDERVAKQVTRHL
jgi:hypothetical protein